MKKNIIYGMMAISGEPNFRGGQSRDANNDVRVKY